MSTLDLKVGVKTDPVQYRFSYEWLFSLLAEEGVQHVQMGSFFELYDLPDKYFLGVREQAERHGIQISSVFTTHRELGGFFRAEPGWVDAARRGFERLIHVAALLGARTAGHNPGSVLRDRMGDKARGITTYLAHFKELMELGRQKGLAALCVEPMSCLAEPPTLPQEITAMLGELGDHHRAHPESTCDAGCCSDVAHGYADADGTVQWNPMQLLDVTLPFLREIHLKNTDTLFGSTFGFGEAERATGIVSIPDVRDVILRAADRIPVTELVGYLEIGGPKLGRDYADRELEGQLRESLRYARETFLSKPPAPTGGVSAGVTSRRVRVSPSLMCADLCALGTEVEQLERLGVEMLHLDLMDARFAPNMPLGLELVRQLRTRTKLPLDVHLMVEDNDWFVDQLSRIGVEAIAVHAESAVHLDRTLTLIREGGARAGVALNPATPLSALDYVRERLDFVVIMTVNPGFAGQSMVPSAIRKITACRTYLAEWGLPVPIEVDGNVSFENIPLMVAAGAEILVAGTSSLFHKDSSRAANMARLRAAVSTGLAARN